jgi:RNA polymerase sigma-B factor
VNAHQDLVDRFLSDRTPTNRDALIGVYMYLCKRGARKFRRAESDPSDLEQVAAIGLVKATDSYSAERTTPFEAYAWIVIVGELMHYVRDCERAVRIPRWLRSLDRHYAVAWEKIAAQQHAEPTVAQLADALAVNVDVIEQIQAQRRAQSPEREGDLPSRFDVLPAPVHGLALEDRLTLVMAVDELDERERVIVIGTYGAGLSQAEIAQMLRLSQSQVSKLLARALSKLSKKVA